MANLKDFKRRLKGLQKKRTLKVGFFEGQKYEDGTSVADVAYWNEFGTPTIPPRPFMRITVAKYSDEWEKLARNAANAHLDGTANIDDTFQSIGNYIAAQIKESIKSNIPPPNKESTIKRKEATRETVVNGINTRGTLVDSGLMLSSVDFEVSDD